MARLSALSIAVAALLPITLIIVVLTVLNLERAVFDVMGGLREAGTANDSAYGILVGLTLFSMILFVPLLTCYVVLSVWSFTKKRVNEAEKAAPLFPPHQQN